jgi:hypothetical protein
MLLGLAAASQLHAEEYYYAIFFGAQATPRRPKYTHTFATIVKATGEGRDMSKYRLEVHTCSWLPETLELYVWKLRPQRGVNLDLESTLKLMVDNREETSEWGPYQIPPESYERGLREIQRLDSGAEKYRAIDGLSRDSGVSNCFHAISDLDRDSSRRRYPLTQAGTSVTFDIVRTMHTRGKILGPGNDHSWIDHALGLDNNPIIHRTYEEGEP